MIYDKKQNIDQNMPVESPDMNKTQPVKIVMVQDIFVVGDIKNNADRIIESSISAAEQGADLVVFPELALVGYPPEDLLHRPGFLRQAEEACLRIQQALKDQMGDTGAIIGLPVKSSAEKKVERIHDRPGNDVYNAAVFIRNGEIEHVYHKRSLPNYAVFDEVRYFVAGDEATVLKVKGNNIGVLICEDVWQKELVAELAEQGAESIIVLNASPFHVNKHAERVEVLQTHADTFGIPILYLNITGGQDELVFDGDSLIVDADAKLRYRASLFDTELIEVTLQGKEILSPSAGNMAATVYSSEAATYKALVTGVRDFVRHNGFTGVVIGLSGGVDSALTLAIAVDALGAENVQAVMMPSRYTADISLTDAEAEARLLGIQYDVIEIEDVFNSFLETLSPIFKDAPADTTEENIQARCRGLLLMAISNKRGRMVLTTGNKSEMAVGYATLYGDMCGGFAPIKDVCKTLVYQLCHYRNSLSEVIPERVLTRPPSAELREDQCDQDSLPDYDVLDRILEMSVEKDKSVDEIVAAGISREEAIHVITLVQRNEHKRRQSAPGIRITRRAFGRDRRYPITSGYEHD